MKDIDFDELDRAVSSVLEPSADGAPTPTVVTDTTEPTSQPSATSEAVATPVVLEPASVAPAAAEPETPVIVPVTKPPLAIKRRGQFMDVVHPSSDMTGKPGETVSAPPRKVTLRPLSASVVPDPTPEATTLDVEEAEVSELATPEVPVESQVSVETIESAPTELVIPDPLDVMQAQEEAKDAANTEAPTVEGTSTDIADASESEVVEDEAAPTTPFLTDTKVDKRPLDAFSAEESELPAEAPSEPAADAEPLPPELQADIVAVEANPSDHVDVSAEEELSTSDKKEDATAETGFNASIPQQYTPADTNADDDHSIFDTNEYHQPLVPTKTKKRGLPGWLVALLVMFLLAGLSAAGGYFWFYYGL